MINYHQFIIVNFALQILSKKAIFKDKKTLCKYTGEYYRGFFMAGVNQVFNFVGKYADDVARYVKACGKRSILECKPINFNSKEFMLPLSDSKGNKIIRYIRDGKQVGQIEYSINKGTFGKYPQYYLENQEILNLPGIKPSIFIRGLRGKRCGTELMQVACRDSIKLTEGRMVLDAQSIDGITSPDAFYYKLGFRKLFQKENEIIENYIKQGKTIPPDSFSDKMYLPRENIKQLLGYKRS